jgi:hypothetical protein
MVLSFILNSRYTISCKLIVFMTRAGETYGLAFFHSGAWFHDSLPTNRAFDTGENLSVCRNIDIHLFNIKDFFIRNIQYSKRVLALQ